MAMNPLENNTLIQLTERMSLIPAIACPLQAKTNIILGGTNTKDRQTVSPFTQFTPVEIPIILNLPPIHLPSIPFDNTTMQRKLTDRVADIRFQVPAGEEAAYILLQEIQTADGTVYDITLPRHMPPAITKNPTMLGAVGTPDRILHFPVHQLVDSAVASNKEKNGVILGGINAMVGNIVFKRILHILRAPVAPTLQQFVAIRENQPQIVHVNADALVTGTLEHFAAWRSHFDPICEHRVLLYIHGFLSNVESSLPHNWIKAFAPHYDAVLAYNHPSIAIDPFQNALEILARIPDDVRLKVDILTHCRGGLVARSLVELHQHTPKLHVTHLLTCGTPHAGTPLAQFEYWDRLISIGMTTASWVLTSTGVAAPLTFVPKLMEYLLRAGAQFFLDLPGVTAITPDSVFLNTLNAPNHKTTAEYVPYAVITSTFTPECISQVGFREALKAMITQTFMQSPNDLIVPTDSMSRIDSPTLVLPSDRIFISQVDHFSYFNKEQTDIQAFAENFFFS